MTDPDEETPDLSDLEDLNWWPDVEPLDEEDVVIGDEEED